MIAPPWLIALALVLGLLVLIPARRLRAAGLSSGSVGLYALTLWGLFKGLYDANIFASVFDVVRPEARGAAAGFMNTIGWLGGGGTAPLVIGLLAEDRGLGTAIALASTVYLAAGVLLLVGIVFFVTRDAARLQQELAAR